MLDILNSSHKRPKAGYFEWWYFHFVSEDVGAINIVLHKTDIFGISHDPYISLSFLPKNQDMQYHRLSLDGIPITQVSGYLRVGDKLITETKQTIRFSLSFPNLRFKGEIIKKLPAVIINDGILYRDETSDRKNLWVIQISNGFFDGILELNDTSNRFIGMAYQDHNWGDIQFQDFASDWIWGHFSNKNTSVTFYQILTHKNNIIDRVVFTTGTTVLTGTLIEASWLKEISNKASPHRYESIESISLLDRRVKLLVPIEKDALMRNRVNEDHNSFLASYCRWYSKSKCFNNSVSLELPGVTEYIRIRRK